MYNLMLYFICFIIYSFVGYVMEVIVCSVEVKKIVNRGFFFGPICPIYGFGSLLLYFGLSGFHDNLVLLFILGLLITSVVEYYASYLIEKIFNNKWWDYSHRKDSINGRICLGNSLFFGVAAILIVRLFQPFLESVITKVPYNTLVIISIAILVIGIIDLIVSCKIAYNMRTEIIVAEQLKKEKLQMIPARFEKKYHNQLIKIKNTTNRLVSAYPNLTKNIKKEFKIVTELIRKENEKRVKKSKES